MSTKGLFIDEEFNIQFVQEVKKYPCLYDNTLKEYSIRSEQDKAWDQVARVYGSTGKKVFLFVNKIPDKTLTCFIKRNDLVNFLIYCLHMQFDAWKLIGDY